MANFDPKYLKDMGDLVPLVKRMAQRDKDMSSEIVDLVTARLKDLKPPKDITQDEVEGLAEALVSGNY